MPDRVPLFERADAAVARGEAWRAKEILRGNLRNRGYDCELFERYGRLLLDLGEGFEAGKYLFLSGRAATGGCPSERSAAVEGYLARVRRNPEAMYFGFPRCARIDIDDYPEAVRATIESLNLPLGLHGRLYAQRRRLEYWEKLRKEKPPIPPTRPPRMMFLLWRIMHFRFGRFGSPAPMRRRYEVRASLVLSEPARSPLGLIPAPLAFLIALILAPTAAVGAWTIAAWAWSLAPWAAGGVP